MSHWSKVNVNQIWSLKAETIGKLLFQPYDNLKMLLSDQFSWMAGCIWLWKMYKFCSRWWKRDIPWGPTGPNFSVLHFVGPNLWRGKRLALDCCLCGPGPSWWFPTLLHPRCWGALSPSLLLWNLLLLQLVEKEALVSTSMLVLHPTSYRHPHSDLESWGSLPTSNVFHIACYCRPFTEPCLTWTG